MPGYSPTTVNLYDIYYVVDDDVVVDVWPILGRYGSATAGRRPARCRSDQRIERPTKEPRCPTCPRTPP